MKIGFNKAIRHTIQAKSPKPYCVHAHKGCIGYHFIVMADDADKAIEALRSNAMAVIAHVRSECKPEDFEQHQLFREPSTKECQEANRLEDEIREWELELAENEDREDELYQVRRETLADHIKANYAKMKELRSNKPFGERASKFEQRIARMTELLGMTYQAEPLDPMRAYPVSYWDDERSITNYCP